MNKQSNNEIWEWIKTTLILAVSSAAATAISTIGSAVFMSDVNWLQVGSATLLSFILAILGRITQITVKVQVQKFRNRKLNKKGIK